MKKRKMTARKFAWIVVVVSIIFTFGLVGLSNAVETYYNNKVPYGAFFADPKARQIKVQKTSKGKVVQAVVPVEKPDGKVEQQDLNKQTKGD